MRIKTPVKPNHQKTLMGFYNFQTSLDTCAIQINGLFAKYGFTGSHKFFNLVGMQIRRVQIKTVNIRVFCNRIQAGCCTAMLGAIAEAALYSHLKPRLVRRRCLGNRPACA